MEYQSRITVRDSLEVSQHVRSTEEHSGGVCDIPADSLSKGMSGTLKLNARITLKSHAAKQFMKLLQFMKNKI